MDDGNLLGVNAQLRSHAQRLGALSVFSGLFDPFKFNGHAIDRGRQGRQP
jgi:hypothetical protein